MIFPIAVEAGINPREFRHLTPREIQICIQEYRKKEKRKAKLLEYDAWLHGAYVATAISCNFSKNKQYPDNPLISTVFEVTDSRRISDGERFALFAMKHNSQVKSHADK